MSSDTMARFRELAGRLEKGDFESLRTGLARDYFGSTPPPDAPGANERFGDIAADLKASLPDLTATVRDIREEDDLIKATVTMNGTHENELWGAPASGDEIAWTTPISVRVIDGRFAVRFDDTSFPQLVGLLRRLRQVNPPDEMHLPPRYPTSPPEFLLKVVMTGQAADKECSHLDQIAVTDPTTRVCELCEETGDIWPALRMCLICGFVGCCDTSTNRHMTAHHEETGHPIFRSINREEGWIWCYADSAFFLSSTLDKYRRG